MSPECFGLAPLSNLSDPIQRGGIDDTTVVSTALKRDTTVVSRLFDTKMVELLRLTYTPMKAMSDDGYTRITLRIPDELHAKLTEEAAKTSKSMNAEIINRLEQTFPQPIEDRLLREMLQERLSALIREKAAADLRETFSSIRNALGKNERTEPETPEELVAIVQAKANAERYFADERLRLIALFKDADVLLRAQGGVKFTDTATAQYTPPQEPIAAESRKPKPKKSK